MSTITELVIGVYIGYMMIANYTRFKEECQKIWKS